MAVRLGAAVLVAVLLLAVSHSALALRMQMLAGRTKCYGAYLSVDALATGSFTVLSASSARVPGFQIKVKSPSGRVVYFKNDMPKGKFAFTATEDGLYQLCMHNFGQQPRSLQFEFKHGVDARDYSAVAKKSHLQPLEAELLKLEDSVREVYEEMMYMRGREEEMRDTNESTNSRVVWYSVFTIVVLLSLGVAQVYILRRDFKARKLISY